MFFEEIIGQNHVVSSIMSLKEKGYPHSFLFAGNSGVGKTTIARVVARELGCLPGNIIEFAAADTTGVDDIRQLLKGLDYSSLGKSPLKFVILDECHRLSKNAWDALLKPIEEPPKHVYYALCTTESVKVPNTIKTRCHVYNLRDVAKSDLLDLIDYVSSEEGITLPKGAEHLIAQESYGSPRRALVFLSMCRGCKTIEEVSFVLEAPMEGSEVIDLCRLIGKPIVEETWKKVKDILVRLKETNPESVRIQICNYYQSAALKAETEKQFSHALNILSEFDKPTNPQTGMTDILLSVAKVLYNNNSV
jgi:DNA polymerase-3 subunit gamma/tau